ncbi:MAG: DUF1059 domain-containing protein [Anaerolineae bacterium]
MTSPTRIASDLAGRWSSRCLHRRTAHPSRRLVLGRVSSQLTVSLRRHSSPWRGFKAKALHCRDPGFDCEGAVGAETEQEVLAQVAAHAQAVHELETVAEQAVDQVRKVMREE